MQPARGAHLASGQTVFLYGLGSLSIGIKNNLLGYFLLIYYNQVLGLDAMLAATAMAIALVVDAITDPWVGIWSDRARTRWGRRHPFMYAAILPFAASYYFILSDPGDLSQPELYARLVFWLIVMRISMTFYEVPRSALGPELTKDYDQRNQLSGLNMAFGWLGGAGIAFIAQRYFLDSFLDRDGYQILAFWGGVGIFVGCALSTVGLHRQIPSLHVPEPRSFKPRVLFAELRETLSNRAWIVLFLSGCFYALLVGTEQGMHTYYNEFLWQFKPAEVSVFSLFQAFSVIVLSLLAPLVARGRDKKKIAIGIFIVTISLGQLPLLLRLLDPHVAVPLFPANGTEALWWILLLHAGFMASVGGLGMVFVISMSMEVVESSQTKTNRREEGLLGTVNSLVQKLIGAGGVLISGVIVSLAGFDQPDVTLEQLQGPVVSRFALMHIVLGITLPLAALIMLLFFNIDRATHEQSIRELGYAEDSTRTSSL